MDERAEDREREETRVAMLTRIIMCTIDQMDEESVRMLARTARELREQASRQEAAFPVAVACGKIPDVEGSRMKARCAELLKDLAAARISYLTHMDDAAEQQSRSAEALRRMGI